MDEEKRYIRTIRWIFTLSEALQQEENVLERTKYPALRSKFFDVVLDQREEILNTVALHLNVSIALCDYSHPEEWNHGSFNFAIPIDIKLPHPKRVWFRTPLPFKSGEYHNPGNLDEKLRCEAATYIYLEENCPEIPIPTLRGFGLTNGNCFTRLERKSGLYRLWHHVRNYVRSIWGYPPLSSFVRTEAPQLSLGYLVIDDAEGQMLFNTFPQYKDDQPRYRNLYRGLARILLSLSAIPQPRIGSFTIDDDGVLSLSNRPLSLRLPWLENQGIPTNIDRKKTYLDSQEFALDCLGYQDSRFIHQPNAVNDKDDGRRQMTVLAMMRLLCPQFTPSTDHFVLKLDDLHQGNIFVDKDWNITSLIDLEWAHTNPIHLQQPPHWITGRDVDCLDGDNLTEFVQRRDEFMAILQQEERALTGDNDMCHLTQRINEGWQSGSYWYFAALGTTTGFYNLYKQHIQPLYTSEMPDVADFWHKNAQVLLQKKVEEREEYLEELRRASQTASELNLPVEN